MPSLRPPLTVFLDSNVLFSASREPRSRFLEFWRLVDVTPATSFYSQEEILRNIKSVDHLARFEALLKRTLRVSDAPVDIVPEDIVLAHKDRPILATAIYASMDYLVTSDTRHFRHLYGTTISHVRILSPREFLDRYKDRLIL